MRTCGSVLVTALLLVLGACGGSEDESSIEPLEPEPTSTAITDTAAADPGERPEDEKTEAGAIAFSEFAIRSIIAAGATGDADGFLTLANAQCDTCVTYAKGISDAPDTGYRYAGEVAVGDGTIVETSGDQFVVDQVAEVPEGQEVDTTDESVADEFEATEQQFRILLRWSGDRWLIENYASEKVAE